jgi:Mor family transcriptional regulator
VKYTNASHVLPDELLKEVQKYVAGEALYIPKLQEKKQWGEGSGARRYYEERNEKIKVEYKEGTKVNDLADGYGLSVESIKRIIYKSK